MRSKTYGSGEELVWSSTSGCYAVRSKSNEIKIYKDFKEFKVFKPFFTPKQIFGGQLLGISSKEFICFYDWETCQMIRNIGIIPRKVYWNDDSVLIASENEFYLLRYNSQLVKNALKTRNPEEEDSQIEDSLILEYNIEEKIREGQFIGETFIYTNNDSRLNYVIGGQVTTITHLEDSKHFFLGYVSKHNRIYIMDKERNILSFRLFVQVLQYETLILRGDLETASLLLPQIPKDEYNRLAKFLDQQGYKQLAMQVTQDDEHCFEIAIQLNDLQKAYEIIKKSKSALETKWKQLGQLALSQCNIELARECFELGNDFGGLLLLYSSIGDREGMIKLAEMAKNNSTTSYNNITFMCYYLLGQVDNCINLLIETKRLPEAALFARTYAPSHVSRVVQLWRSELTSDNQKVNSQRLKSIADSLADPIDYPNMFNNFGDSLQVEKFMNRDFYTKLQNNELSSNQYQNIKKSLYNTDWIEQYKQEGESQFKINYIHQEVEEVQVEEKESSTTPIDTTTTTTTPQEE
ncbi:coatomer protein complex subunit beta [Naegleria gruberi]|uniref:Coatomer protein complex subunit beta n=1 Tax=Naegleria gruberi TaxID=5762 RepID=D2W5X7_NAEGR|nr:coatomer protein complex subunit beta [Naegleria gruberi]EFC35525.1 coatomer protein complex subunit beta [Naegleria gruberi]|eukprot:XP_002668269.1 coatomer protein complex subunit beta [Naegleria gruberi strain NEG-M]